MKTLMVAVVAIAASMVAFADTVTFTWKGGDGNWSDPAMWTASDGSTDRYPNAATDYAVFSPGEKAVITVTENVSPYDVRFAPANADLCFKGDPDVLPLIKLNDANTEEQGTNHNWKLTFDGVKCTWGASVYTGQSLLPRHNCVLTMKNKSYVSLKKLSFGGYKETPTSGYTTPTNFVIAVESGSTFLVGSCMTTGLGTRFIVDNATVDARGGSLYSANNCQYFSYGNSKFLMRNSFFVNQPATLNLSLPEEPYADELVKLTDNASKDYTDPYVTINILPDSPALKTSVASDRVYRIFNWAGTKKGYVFGIDPKCITWKFNGKALKPYMKIVSSYMTPELEEAHGNPQYIDFVLGPKPGMMLLLR